MTVITESPPDVERMKATADRRTCGRSGGAAADVTINLLVTGGCPGPVGPIAGFARLGGAAEVSPVEESRGAIGLRASMAYPSVRHQRTFQGRP